MKNKQILINIFIYTLFIFIIITLGCKIQAKGVDGTTIVLNPGHGGIWTGCANGQKGLVEKDITLKLAEYLKEQLMKYYDVNVILTHDGVNFPNNDASDLAARAMIARNNNADLYVSLHIDDATSTSLNGATVYVTSRTELPKYKEGMTKLGNKILRNLNILGINSNGVVNNKLCNDREPKYQYYDGSQADYYADIRHAMRGDTLDDLGSDFRDGTGIPTVLIEHCYINNVHDVQYLDSEEDLRKLAKADGDAIIDYLQLRLKGEVISNMSIDKEKINLIKGENQKVTAVVGPETAKNKDIKWTSENEKIAKVDSNGNITGISTGIVKIVATSVDNPNVSKSIIVNVEDYELKFENEKENIAVDKSKILDVKITPTWIENKQVIWESSNSDIVEVTGEGKIIAKKEGIATIKVTWKDKNLSDEIIINAIKINGEIKINKYNLKDGKISGFGQKVKIQEFLSNIEIIGNLQIEVKCPNKEYIGTNTKIIIKQDDIIIEQYECLIYGDINGDGKISAMDYTLIKNHIMEVKKIIDKNMKLTADINGDNKISAMDYTLVKNHIMEVKKIPVK